MTGLGLALVLTACRTPDQGPTHESLRIGVLPEKGEDVLRKQITPLLDFVSRKSGFSYELVIPNKYEELLQLFSDGKIDMAYFGGVTFTKANIEHAAVPLVMRDVDTRFTSVIVTSIASAKTLEDLQGKRFGFGSRLSTSGHLMPRFFMEDEYGVIPEEYFESVQYSGKHDRTAYWVRDGVIDAGAASGIIIHKMLADGRLQPGDIRIILTTPHYPNYVWAVHPRIQPVLRERIRQAFLQLSIDDPQHADILANVCAGSFYPAVVGDFSELRKIMSDQDLL